MGRIPLMDFKKATDEFAECGIGLAVIAKALGASYSSVKQARLNPRSPHYRTPPQGWQPKLRGLAEERGGRLQKLAEELDDA